MALAMAMIPVLHAGDLSDNDRSRTNSNIRRPKARQLAFSTTWTGITPSDNAAATNPSAALASGSQLFALNTGTNNIIASGNTNTLIIGSMNGMAANNGDAQFFSPDKSRGSIFMKDGTFHRQQLLHPWCHQLRPILWC